MQYTIWKKDNWEILEGRRRWAANKTKDSSGDCQKRYKDVLISDQGRCSHFSSFFLVKPGIKWCSEARRQLRIHFCHFSLFCDFHIPDISLFCRLWLSLCSSWSLKMSLTKIFSHLIDFSPKDKLFLFWFNALLCAFAVKRGIFVSHENRNKIAPVKSYISVSFCRAGISAVLRNFLFKRRASVWPNMMR